MGIIMKKIKLFSAVILAAMLCACGHESADIQETNITTAEITTASAEMTTTAQTTAVTTAVTTVATTSKAMVGMDIPKDMRYEYDEEDGNKYAFYQFMPVAIHSNAERVTVKNVNDTIHFREGNLFGGILRSEVSQLPNCRVLTFEEGIEDINWCDQYVNAPSLEILRFPASMDSLILMRNSNFIPESEALPAEAYVPYDPNRRVDEPYFSYTLKDRYGSAAAFENAQKIDLCYGTFLTRETLTHIEIAEGNARYYDDNGVLYIKNDSGLQSEHIIYHPALTDLPKTGLICLPQSHPAVDGSYTVPDGTEAVLSGAVYHPKYIDTLILPDSLLYISPTAIIATAEHPLTVVCSHGSAAAAYVETFGEQYHLTVEYAD